MLNPRIYRMGLIPVVLAVIVFAFSLDDQQGALTTNISPDLFNGGNADSTMKSLAREFPARQPGSSGDAGLAARIKEQLGDYRFQTVTEASSVATALGTRSVTNVYGIKPAANNDSIVIVSDRDALSPRSEAGLSGTAVMLELARVLSSQGLNRTLIFASTGGSDGTAGAERLASALPGPVDAVIVLGDLARADGRQPVVAPWSDGQNVAPMSLRNTVAATLEDQAGLTAPQPGLGGQLAHLAFPMAGTEQGPFDSAGEPAVLLSLTNSPDVSGDEHTSEAEIGAMGRAVLEATDALETGPAVPGPSSYLVWDGKVIPAWAVRMLVLVLMLPVLAVAMDGLARARRKGHVISRWAGWVAASAVPLVLALLLVLVARATGWVGAAPPAPVQSGAIPLGGGGIALLVLLTILIVSGLVWLRRALVGLLGLHDLSARRPWKDGSGAVDYPAGAAVAMMLVLCVVALIVWFQNPFAALLLLPALHLWVWAGATEPRLPVPVRILMLLLGLAPVALVALAFASTFGLGPMGMAWSIVLLVGGGAVGPLTVVVWSLVFACAVAVALMIVRVARAPAPEALPVSIRGPLSYAGPGSLGGTKSALRR